MMSLNRVAEVAPLSCFTPHYCSPSFLSTLFCHEDEDAPNDMWAFGVILLWMLTCTDTTWQKTFGPSAAQIVKIAQQESEQRHSSAGAMY